MAIIIIFNSDVVNNNKIDMTNNRNYLNERVISFLGLLLSRFCVKSTYIITYERPLPAGYAFTRERSERVVSANTLSRNSHEEHATSGNVYQKNFKTRV